MASKLGNQFETSVDTEKENSREDLVGNHGKIDQCKEILDQSTTKPNEHTIHSVCSSATMTSQPSLADTFWSILRTDLGVELPLHIKHLLTLNGFDNAMSFRGITEQDITEMEKYARCEMQDDIPETANREEYFGVFSNRIERYRILPGHRRLLDGIKEYVLKKPINYFTHYETFLQTSQDLRGQLSKDSTHSKESKSENCKDLKNYKTQRNAENEEAKVQRLIFNAVKGSCGSDNALLDIVSNIQVSVIEAGRANVSCPFCDILISLKTATSATGSSRWIISNFTRHIRNIHLDTKRKQKPIAASTKNNTILSLFSKQSEIISGKRKESDTVEESSDEDNPEKALLVKQSKNDESIEQSGEEMNGVM